MKSCHLVFPSVIRDSHREGSDKERFILSSNNRRVVGHLEEPRCWSAVELERAQISRALSCSGFRFSSPSLGRVVMKDCPNPQSP